MSEPNEKTRLELKPPTAKKPYSKPTLIVYGTLQDITRMVGNQGAKDNGAPGNMSRSH